MAVKPKYVKDLAKEIFESYGENINADFDRNKTVVEETTDVESREVRNRVAGYLCSLSRQEHRKES